MTNRVGDWIQTSNGLPFWPLDPREHEIFISDIAAALSKQCRFGGHCKKFYSVAEHCILLARYAPDNLKLEALMHDAAEAYLVDLPRPIKNCIPEYREIEAKLEKVIFKRFNIPYPISEEVKALDNAILFTERKQNMIGSLPWANEVQPLPIELLFLSPKEAEYEFLYTFDSITGE